MLGLIQAPGLLFLFFSIARTSGDPFVPLPDPNYHPLQVFPTHLFPLKTDSHPDLEKLICSHEMNLC